MVVTRKSERKKAPIATKQTAEEVFADISAGRTTATPIRNPYTTKVPLKKRGSRKRQRATDIPIPAAADDVDVLAEDVAATISDPEPPPLFADELDVAAAAVPAAASITDPDVPLLLDSVNYIEPVFDDNNPEPSPLFDAPDNSTMYLPTPVQLLDSLPSTQAILPTHNGIVPAALSAAPAIDASAISSIIADQAAVASRLANALPQSINLEVILSSLRSNKTIFGSREATEMFKNLRTNTCAHDNAKYKLEKRLFGILGCHPQLKDLCTMIQDPEMTIIKQTIPLFYCLLRGTKSDVKKHILNYILLVFSQNLVKVEYEGVSCKDNMTFARAQYESTTSAMKMRMLFSVFNEKGIIFNQKRDFAFQGQYLFNYNVFHLLCFFNFI